MRSLTEKLNTLHPKAEDYLALARLNRPIGIYLLLWPTLWALWFAAEGFPGWHLLVVFTFGTVLTRSAGCVVNDIADREFDKHVKRTVDRPLAAGRLTVEEAIIYLGALTFLALLLVLTTNWITVGLAALGAVIAVVYPFMKRYTYLPQAVLGVAFSFGIPMAFTAMEKDIPNYAWVLMIANVIWTVAYDTEYAMVDRDDDVRIGVRSTAILFGDMDKMMIGALQVIFLGMMWMVIKQVDMSWTYHLGLVAAAILFGYQHYMIKDRKRELCLEAFLNNHWVGLVIFTGTFLSFL